VKIRLCVSLLLLVASLLPVSAQQQVSVRDTDIGGGVTGPSGPEAGVWVIAETVDLPTKFAKIVVTDDLGRYLIPDLPRATYRVWVRGFGLVDSPKVEASPGRNLNLTAVPARSEKDATQYYPAMYWWALLNPPPTSEFPMPKIKSQGEWLNIIKVGACGSCHALGTPWTRTLSQNLGEFKSSVEAWQRRLTSGQAQFFMARDIGRLDTERALQMFADWTDRMTLWDWGRPTGYLHDLVSTDRRNPRLNSNGKVYGSPEDSTDFSPILDPVTGTASEVLHPVRDPETPSSKSNSMAPSAVWGPDPIWDSKTLNHNPMFDEKGRVWFTARIRPNDNPPYCKKGSDHPSAKAFPIDSGGRNLSFYDPATGRFTLIYTCFPTHHLNFASDANNTLWTSAGVAGPGVLGWLNRKMYEETGDEVRSQGWTPFVLDTNGNGRRDEWVEPNQPLDPTKDKRIAVNNYSVAVSPADGAVWGSVLGYPGGAARVTPGDDPTHTALTEFYEVPAPGFGPRGGDVDTDGVFWMSLASGHLGSFDRRKCKGPLNGPNATGKHCPEGWTLHQLPGPQFRTVNEPGSAEGSYYAWVDWFDTFGLGRNVPFAMGNLNDAIYALVDGRLITLRMPYPMGMFAKNVDGRIDDANAGWKGRGLWTTTGTRTFYHNEGGKGSRPQAIKIQLRPDPLAR